MQTARAKLFSQDPDGWPLMFQAFGQARTWAAAPGGVPAQARGAYLEFAGLYLELMGAFRTMPHLAPELFEPAIAICRADAGFADREPAFVHALCSAQMDFGDLDALRSHLSRENLERYDASGSDDAAWCWLLASSLARVEGRSRDAKQLLNATAERYDPGRPGHAQLPIFLDSGRLGLALYLGRIDQAALAFADMKSGLETTDSWFGEHALRLHSIRLRLATGRPAGVGVLAVEGIAAVEEKLAGITGGSRRRCNTLLARYQLYAGVAARRLGEPERARALLRASLEGKDIGPGSTEVSLGQMDMQEARLNLAMVEALEGHPAAAQAQLDELEQVFTTLEAEDADAPWVHTPRLDATRALCARLAGTDPAELRPPLAELRGTYALFLDRWDAAPIEPGGIGFLHFESRRFVLEQLVELTLAVEGAAGAPRALEAVLAAQARGSMARELGLRAPSLDEVRELLGPQGGLLLYLPGTDASHLFLLDAEACTHVHLPRLGDLRASQAALTRSLDPAQPSEQARAAAAVLGAQLLPLAALAALEGWDEVTVVGADLLGSAPIEVLPLASGVPLGIARPVTHLPSLSVGVYLRERRAAEGQRWSPPRGPRYTSPGVAAIAPTYSSAARDAFGPLPRIELDNSHRRSLSAAWPGGRLLWGAEAQVATLGLEARPRALHLLTHGVQQPGELRPAAVVLAGRDDLGLLNAERVEALWSGEDQETPDLVTLGVCRTGSSPSRLGEDGVQHLGGTFLAAGAEVVVFAAGDLDRDATARLLEGFHRYETGGATPAEALRRARADLAQEARFAHPYDWGQLQVLGLGNQVLRAVGPLPGAAKRSRWTPGLGFTLGGLALAGLVAAALLARRPHRARQAAS